MQSTVVSLVTLVLFVTGVALSQTMHTAWLSLPEPESLPDEYLAQNLLDGVLLYGTIRSYDERTRLIEVAIDSPYEDGTVLPLRAHVVPESIPQLAIIESSTAFPFEPEYSSIELSAAASVESGDRVSLMLTRALGAFTVRELTVMKVATRK